MAFVVLFYLSIDTLLGNRFSCPHKAGVRLEQNKLSLPTCFCVELLNFFLLSLERRDNNGRVTRSTNVTLATFTHYIVHETCVILSQDYRPACGHIISSVKCIHRLIIHIHYFINYHQTCCSMSMFLMNDIGNFYLLRRWVHCNSAYKKRHE